MLAFRRSWAAPFALALLVAESCGPGSEPPPSALTTPAAPPSAMPSPSPASPQASPSPSASPTAAEQHDRTWHRSLDFSVAEVDADDRGNVYATGFVPRGPEEYWGKTWAMVLEKTDPDGDRVWLADRQSASIRFPHAAGQDVAISPDGSVVYVVGAIMNDSTEIRRARLWAFSAEGEPLWIARTAQPGMTLAAAAGTSGVVAGGYGWVGAWSADGNRLWTRSFEEPAGGHCDGVTDVAVGDEGEVYVVGYLDTTPMCGSMEGGAYEDADIVVQRRSSEGDVLWSRVLADPDVTDNDWAFAADIAGRRIFVAGERDGRAWLARLSADGEIVWERPCGRPGTRAIAVSVAPWGGMYVLGPTGGLRRFSLEGDLEWDRRMWLDPNETASGVATAPGGFLYVTADVFSVSGDLWRLSP